MSSSPLDIIAVLSAGQDDERRAALLRDIRLRFMKIARFKQIPAQDVEDVVNDAIVKVLGNFTSYQARAPFEHWLATVFSNVWIDHLRKRQRRLAIENLAGDREQDEDWPDRQAQPADPGPSPETLVIAAELKQVVLDLVERWSRSKRKAKNTQRDAQIVLLGLCDSLAPSEILDLLETRFSALNGNTIRIVLARFRSTFEKELGVAANRKGEAMQPEMGRRSNPSR